MLLCSNLNNCSRSTKFLFILTYQRFRLFCLGKLRTNPWSELDGLQPETKIINEHLEKINTKGFLTINSQPAVNGEKSDSPTVGRWENVVLYPWMMYFWILDQSILVCANYIWLIFLYKLDMKLRQFSGEIMIEFEGIDVIHIIEFDYTRYTNILFWHIA